MASGSLVKRGNSWRVMIYAGRDPVSGRKRQVTRTVHGTRKEAEAVRNEMLVSVAQGKTSTTSKTFGELLDAWFEANQADWSPRTALEHRRIIDAVLKPALGAKKLARLRASDLDALYARLRDGGGPTGRKLAAATVRKFHTVARCALQQAVKWEWLAVNPAANASPPKGKRKEPNPPKPDDLARLLAYTEDRDSELFVYLRPSAVLGGPRRSSAVLGARRGELLGIRWADFAEDYRWPRSATRSWCRITGRPPARPPPLRGDPVDRGRRRRAHGRHEARSRESEHHPEHLQRLRPRGRPRRGRPARRPPVATEAVCGATTTLPPGPIEGGF